MEASHGSFSVDAAVQATNDEASTSKLSCVRKGYMQDDYVQYFVRRPAKRAPIINRGYYARWASIRKLLMQFLEVGTSSSNGHSKKQILSLGAGFDTLYFQLQDERQAPHLFVELDFKEVTSKKAIIIDAYEPLRSKLGSTNAIKKEQGQILSDHYKLLPADLRDLNSLDMLLDQANMDPSLPTLILAECVLIYLDPNVSRTVVKWAGQKFPNSIFVVYEQIHPDDGFGRQMLKNLEKRGCPLLGLHDTPTLEAKKRRFLDLGWQRAEALDMDVIYNQHIDAKDRRRIERLELFDEFEEWHILQEHYCISYGINDQQRMFENFGFQEKQADETPVCSKE
ncbi:hypothetical protein GOP47_0030143 [Adiantum capillus-veneris]|nr:hypothetical protein GOP47_0030143 [Adiantum capillus-veneris]